MFIPQVKREISTSLVFTHSLTALLIFRFVHSCSGIFMKWVVFNRVSNVRGSPCVWETRKYDWQAQEDELSCAVFPVLVMDIIWEPEAPDTPGLKWLFLRFLCRPSCSVDLGTELTRQEVTERQIHCTICITDRKRQNSSFSLQLSACCQGQFVTYYGKQWRS